ncbi:MAG: hypothetical protein HDR51_04935 [Treponema sp.]|nr:hypothetical protein [Treponema sp.]
MNNENFSQLIKLLNIENIQIIDTHESVFDNPKIPDGTEINIETARRFNKEDPRIDKNTKTIEFHLKYTFTFSIEETKYFLAEYIILISFTVLDMDTFLELFADPELKKMFMEKQLNRTLWSILRGTVLDAFNRHSLPPVSLPWIV